MIICIRPEYVQICIYIYIYISKARRSENRPICTPYLFFYAIKPLSNLKSWWWREECCCFRLKSLYTYIFIYCHRHVQTYLDVLKNRILTLGCSLDGLILLLYSFFLSAMSSSFFISCCSKIVNGAFSKRERVLCETEDFKLLLLHDDDDNNER